MHRRPHSHRILATFVWVALLSVGCAEPTAEGTTEDAETAVGPVSDGGGQSGADAADVHGNQGDDEPECFTDSDCAGILTDLPVCIVAACDEVTLTCVQANAHGGMSCDDGSICTQNDVCLAGECLPGAAMECGDDNLCTDDTCDPETGCTNTPNEFFCDDGNACTLNDLCQGGVCQSGSDAICDDDNLCTDDACDVLLGCVYPPIPGAECSDGSECTLDDICLNGECTSGIEVDCNDSNPCTDDMCAIGTGCINVANALECDDGELCTLDDTCTAGTCVGVPDTCSDLDDCTVDACQPETGCTHTGHDGPCNDGNTCTVNDFCVEGECIGTTNECDDDNTCTVDFCHPVTGCETASLTGSQCDDGDVCTAIDTCGEGGVCESGPPLNCDDLEACTIDSCDTILGCQNVAVDTACDDHNACTTDDLCVAGECVGNLLSCADGNPCTTDGCSTTLGCTFPFNSIGCDDGDLCTVNDVCTEGVCLGLTNTCDDGNQCTTDLCDDQATCQNTVYDGPCDDDNACTVGDSCLNAVCVSGPVALCDDNSACTIDLCDPEEGCSHTMIPSCMPPMAWPIINEFDYEQLGDDTADFIELVIVGTQTVEMAPYTLELIDGTTGQAYLSLPLSSGTDQLHPGERLVIGPTQIVTSLQDQVATIEMPGDFLDNGGVDGDAIRLIRATPAGPVVVDTVAYEHAVPGANEGDNHAGFDGQFGGYPTSFSRCPDALDTDDNDFDFELNECTPGFANPCFEDEE